MVSLISLVFPYRMDRIIHGQTFFGIVYRRFESYHLSHINKGFHNTFFLCSSMKSEFWGEFWGEILPFDTFDRGFYHFQPKNLASFKASLTSVLVASDPKLHFLYILFMVFL